MLFMACFRDNNTTNICIYRGETKKSQRLWSNLKLTSQVQQQQQQQQRLAPNTHTKTEKETVHISGITKNFNVLPFFATLSLVSTDHVDKMPLHNCNRLILLYTLSPKCDDDKKKLNSRAHTRVAFK